jgi:hypothetical protein
LRVPVLGIRIRMFFRSPESGSGSITQRYGSGFFSFLKLCLQNTVKWGNIVFGFNIVTSLPKFLTGHNSRTNEFISWV